MSYGEVVQATLGGGGQRLVEALLIISQTGELKPCTPQAQRRCLDHACSPSQSLLCSCQQEFSVIVDPGFENVAQRLAEPHQQHALWSMLLTRSRLNIFIVHQRMPTATLCGPQVSARRTWCSSRRTWRASRGSRPTRASPRCCPSCWRCPRCAASPRWRPSAWWRTPLTPLVRFEAAVWHLARVEPLDTTRTQGRKCSCRSAFFGGPDSRPAAVRCFALTCAVCWFCKRSTLLHFQHGACWTQHNCRSRQDSGNECVTCRLCGGTV